MREIVLAGGCFWGVEAYFERKKGVVETTVGYANGIVENPTYEQVKTATTGHVEACYIKYDEEQVSLKTLLDYLWLVIEPTLKDQQGPDIGSQYRTGIYYIGDEDLGVIMEAVKEEQLKHDKPIVTEVESLKCYYLAETYHQKYLHKNPSGYCHINLDT